MFGRKRACFHNVLFRNGECISLVYCFILSGRIPLYFHTFISCLPSCSISIKGNNTFMINVGKTSAVAVTEIFSPLDLPNYSVSDP